MYADDPLLASAVAYNQRLLAKQTTAALKQLLARVGVPITSDPSAASIVCAIGRPAQEIPRVAKRVGADLIVMGTQGRSGGARLFFGSVTERVLRRTTIPVLAVPPGAPLRGLQSWPRKRVVCALELGPLAGDDVRAAAAVASAFEADLTLVHVVLRTEGPPWRESQLSSQDRGKLKVARGKLEALGRHARSILRREPQTMALLGNPAEEISAAATDVGAGLIVLTLRRGHGLFGRRQGTISYRVLCGASVPVLALRPRGA
jgi:nucleotide-binding universal stress UspA family protein